MKQAIVYVNSEFFGEYARGDLLHQERRCLGYAQAQDKKVAKVFRQKPWKGRKEGMFSEALRYIKDNPGKIDVLIVYQPRNLDRSKMYFETKRQAFKSLGVKIEFAIYHMRPKKV